MLWRHITLGSVLIASLVAADDAPTPVDDVASAESEAGFLPLFNGQDLAGWHGAVDSYVAEEGRLVCRPSPGGGNLYTDAEFADFEVRFEFRLSPGANNGLGVRVPDGGHASSEGMEIQILDDDDPQYADLSPWQYHGSVYGIVAAERGHLRPDGEWNSQTIRIVGREVVVTLNGTTIVDANLDEALAAGAIDGKEHPGARRASGHLCLCGHGTVIEFRDLRIRDLAVR